MIHAARSELAALLMRAAVGRGLPPGIADEFIEAVLAMGAEGPGLALAALGPDPRPAQLTRSRNGGDCLAGPSLPMLAPSAFDLAPIKVRHPDTRLLAGYAAARGGGWTLLPVPGGVQVAVGAAHYAPKDAPPYPVRPVHWQALQVLGEAALVPATEETAAGAGAGAIDND